MENKEYSGWNLFNKVIIVAKEKTRYCWDTGKQEFEGYQGYIVDPSNKSMLKSARNWGIIHRWENSDDGGRKYIEIEPEEFEYENKGFKLALYKAAGYSNQGGKLSFWNCLITAPDGKKFIVGIAADLLLDMLKCSTVVNGEVQADLVFARQNGQVGMLSEDMQLYKDALRDMEIKANAKKGMTSKFTVGHIYETLTESNVYLGKFYRWYEPIYGDYSRYHYQRDIVAFKKLSKPIEFVMYPRYQEDKNNFSDYIDLTGPYSCRDKAPKRKESDKTIKMDISFSKFIEGLEEKCIYEYIDKDRKDWIATDFVGISICSSDYEMPALLRSRLTEAGFSIR